MDGIEHSYALENPGAGIVVFGSIYHAASLINEEFDSMLVNTKFVDVAM